MRYENQNRLVIVVMIACLAICWLILPYLKPKPVCKLPSTAPALGGKVTLQSVKWLPSGELQVTVTGRPKPGSLPMTFGETYLIFGYNSRRSSGGQWLPSEGKKPAYRKNDFDDVPKGVTSVDVLQEVFLDKPSLHPTIKIKHVSPNKLPISRTIGSATITIHKMVINKYVKSIPTPKGPVEVYCDGKPCIVALIQVHCSTGRMEYWLQLAEHDPHHWGSNHTDVEGLCSRQVEQSCPPPPATFVEKVIGLVDRKRAYESRMKRASGPSICGYKDSWQCYAFTPIYPEPKELTLEVDGEIPPDKKDVKLVVFHNVPITH